MGDHKGPPLSRAPHAPCWQTSPVASLTALTGHVYALVTAMQSYDTDPEDGPFEDFEDALLGPLTQEQAAVYYGNNVASVPNLAALDQEVRCALIDAWYQQMRDAYHMRDAPIYVNVNMGHATHRVQVTHSMDVAVLKAMLVPLFGVPLAQQQLKHKDALMEDGYLFDYYLVNEKDTIYLEKKTA